MKMISHPSTDFSIILPTLYEAKNIPEIIYRIHQINFSNRKFEILIVDDNSQDGTEEIVSDLQKSYPALRLIIRQGKRGLSEAVIQGLNQVIYPIIVIMDADLSHPPEKIPDMLTALQMPQVDLVIGSRYVSGGSSDEAWPLMRRFCSRFAALFAKALIKAPVKDPLSGFLAFHKKTYLSGHPLQAIGWKIGLEIMVKCSCRHIVEVPIHFSERKNGMSKLNLRIVISYLKHIGHLVWFKLKFNE